MISKKLNSFTDWLSGIWAAIFPSSSTTVTNSLTRSRNSSANVDLTFPDTVNYDLAMDLYYNKRAGYKLAAFFCHAIISLPLTFMGVPHFDIKKQKTQRLHNYWKARLDFYNDKYIMLKKEIQKICHITGTVAIYPWFDSKAGFVKWLLIKSKYISDVYVNPDTQELSGITTTICFSFKIGEVVYYFTEKKTYTEMKIIINRLGYVPHGLPANEVRRNPAGILPVIFTNDKEAGEFEGHSDFERMLSLMKAYSEINIRAHEEAGNITAKLIQKVVNYDKWMSNNGFVDGDGNPDVSQVSIENKDFVINVEGEETEINVPQNLLDNHIKLMNIDYWGMVETSGIPEIWFGRKTSGNHATTEEQDEVGLSFVKEKQTQVTDPYIDLLDATIRLEAMAYNQNPPEGLLVTWDQLDTLTELERSQVFDNWCSGFQKLADKHGVSLEVIHRMLLELTKGRVTEDFEEFKEQIKEYGTIRSMLEAEYGVSRDFNPDFEVDTEGNGNGKGNKAIKEIIQKAIDNREIIIRNKE